MVAFGLAIAALASLPSLGTRPVAEGARVHQLGRIEQYRAAIAGLQFPPAIAPGDYGGWGSPAFLFEPHPFVLIASFFSWLSGDVVAAAAVTLTLLSLLSVWSTFFAARELGAGRGASLLAAAAYALSPGLLHLRHGLSDYAAFGAWSLAPLAVAGIASASRSGIRAVLCVAAGIASVTSGHLVVGLGVTALAVVLAVVMHAHNVRALARTGAGVVLGLAISSFYWLPAVALGPQVNLWLRTADRFEGATGLVGLSDVIAVTGVVGLAVLGLLLLSGAAAIFLAREADRRMVTVLLVGALGSVALSAELSRGFWDTFVLTGFAENPHVMSALSALSASMSIAVASRGMDRWEPRRRVGAVAVVAVLVAVASLPSLLRWRAADDETARAARAQLALVPSPESLFRMQDDPYLPVAADREAWRKHYNDPSPILRLHGRGSATEFGAGATELSLMVDSPRGFRIEFARYAFAQWVAATDIGRLEAATGESGTLMVDVPAGFYELWLEYRPPRIRRVTSGVSAVCAVLWLVLLELYTSRSRRLRRAPHG